MCVVVLGGAGSAGTPGRPALPPNAKRPLAAAPSLAAQKHQEHRAHTRPTASSCCCCWLAMMTLAWCGQCGQCWPCTEQLGGANSPNSRELLAIEHGMCHVPFVPICAPVCQPSTLTNARRGGLAPGTHPPPTHAGMQLGGDTANPFTSLPEHATKLPCPDRTAHTVPCTRLAAQPPMQYISRRLADPTANGGARAVHGPTKASN